MQRTRRNAAVIGACLLALGAGGCSETGAFPNLGRIPVMDERLLTSSERQDAIRSMRQDQDSHDKEAAKEIEER